MDNNLHMDFHVARFTWKVLAMFYLNSSSLDIAELDDVGIRWWKVVRFLPLSNGSVGVKF